MLSHLLKQLNASALHTLPLTLLIVGLNVFIALLGGTPMSAQMLLRFLIGAVMLPVGMSLIEHGAEQSLIPMGEEIGAYLTRTGKYSLLMICCVLMGVCITAAEPDIAVFAHQYPGVADRQMIYTIAIGVGVFLALGVLRVIKKIPLPAALAVFYAAAFAIAHFAPDSFLGVAFDSSGVATGPILVPFIMALGIGLATVRGGSVGDTFGTVAVCAVGPVIALLLLGVFGGGGGISAHSAEAADNAGGVLGEYLHALPEFVAEVALALLPIAAFFVLFLLIFLRLPKSTLIRTGVGLAYSFIGHTVFLTGVTVGFIPAGEYLGGEIASLPGMLSWLIIPAGMLMGCFVVIAEPAVRVMNAQVEELTVGAVNKKAMLTTVAVGAAFSAGISMLRVMTGMPLRWFLFGGYAIALILSFIVPRMFTAIAFDSGGVASGTIALVFLMPFARGADIALTGGEENLLTDAFGLMALIAVIPIISIQALGLIYTVKLKRASAYVPAGDASVTIIEFDTEDA